MLPLMRSKNQAKKYSITAFGGFNPSHSRRINEIAEGLNTSSQNYPALSASKSHSKVRTLADKALTGGYFDELYTLEYSGEESGDIYLCTQNSKTKISSFESLEELSKERTMSFMKDEIFIIPDNVIYYTNTGTVKAGCVSESTSKTSAQKKFEKESLTSDKMPMPYNTWYSSYITHNSIVAMSETYRVSSKSYEFFHLGVSDSFEIGDIVTVKMNVKPIDVTHDDMYKKYVAKMSDGITLKIKDLVLSSHSTPSGNVSEYTEIVFEDNSVDMGGYDDVVVLGITIEKGVPNFVDVCTQDNRMWGVTSNTICSSMLGDSSKWYDFTQDSYGTLPSSCFTTEVDTDGSFTAIIGYNGNILAFKEDCIHKVYGNEPREYVVTRVDCPGVAQGSKDTLAIVGGILYYMGRDGVYAYSGSLPRLITKDILPPGCTATRGGGDERYYYIEVLQNGVKIIYTYDTFHDVWHISQTPNYLKSFVTSPEGQYIITEDSILMMNEDRAKNWIFKYSLGDKEFSSKHICAVSIRYTLGDDAEFILQLENNHSTYLLTKQKGKCQNKWVNLRLPVSCDRDARLTFSGHGDFTLNSLEISYKETGIYD